MGGASYYSFHANYHSQERYLIGRYYAKTDQTGYIARGEIMLRMERLTYCEG